MYHPQSHVGCHDPGPRRSRNAFSGAIEVTAKRLNEAAKG